LLFATKAEKVFLLVNAEFVFFWGGVKIFVQTNGQAL